MDSMVFQYGILNTIYIHTNICLKTEINMNTHKKINMYTYNIKTHTIYIAISCLPSENNFKNIQNIACSLQLCQYNKNLIKQTKISRAINTN